LRVAREHGASSVGRQLKVLVEREAAARELAQANVESWEHGLIRSSGGAATQLEGRYLVCRGEADAPDIDGRVYVRGRLPAGSFARVRVVGHTDYDLIGEPACD
jgi:ribosomal protein S12 methylthiotransferase